MPGTPRDIATLESWFETGDVPTQQQFYDLFASFLHYLKIKQATGASTSDVMSQKAVTDQINALQSLIEGINDVETLLPLWDDEAEYNTDGSDDGQYSKHPDSSGNLRLWETKIDNNVGNEPPTDPEITEDDNWKEVSPAKKGYIPTWEPGLYSPGAIVYHAHSTPRLTGLYRMELAAPLTSVSIEGETNLMYWKLLGRDYIDEQLEDIYFRTQTNDLALSWDAFQFVIEEGGSDISAGIKGDIIVPYDCGVVSWTLLADAAGSIVVDVWHDTFNNFPPDSSDSICNTGGKPTLSSEIKAALNTQNGVGDPSTWTNTTLQKGDVIRINVESASTVKRVTLVLHFGKEIPYYEL